MIKISDAFQHTHKKISRNKVLLDIFKKYAKILEYKTLLNYKMLELYNEKSSIVIEINNIELLQANEYTIDRQLLINSLVNNLVTINNTAEINNILEKIKCLKQDILESKKIISQIQDLIPDNLNVINYKFGTDDTNKSCGQSAIN